MSIWLDIAVDGGVFGVDIVANFGFGHGFAHSGGGMGDGIGTEVYCVHERFLLPSFYRNGIVNLLERLYS